ncbi:granule lattice protein (macronuclear) [Tetrahymena thermophila SB210]|uniref:Granule lattice protein n=2 Tax=Tetrahymena thermophila TaxID=5911 RepID=Q240R1_TETTS|nr:granule lattice protein [Tetrahymena thermophila SB210]AAC27988.1 granule lattice protein 4 precursor [Tetrahymena thermophila]EAS02353.3 granule lattice protein [Tetrahymena thermophila SB210]|eukprot:XP_001022598.3 granule lattice protein [Tetrahymena thermophila SB210]
MRYAALFLLALISFNAVYAVSLRKSSDAMKTSFALERLRFIGKKSPIAKQIISAVELHLTTGGLVDDVIDLVKQAQEDVANRNVALQAEYTAKRGALEDQINTTTQQLNEENDRLAVVNDAIDALNGQIDSLNTQIANLVQQLQNLQAREDAINQAREVDVKTYEVRKQRDENSLAVLEQIIQRLLALQQRGNAFLQVSKKEIERILKRIPKSNPIQALVQLSTKFDEQRLAEVISKLQTIQAAIQASYIEDANGEVADKQRYDALIQEIATIRAQTQQQLADAQQALSDAEASLAQFVQEQGNLQQQIAVNEGILADAQAALAHTIATYEARIQEGQEALAAINLALDVLQQNQSDLQGVEDFSNAYNAYQAGNSTDAGDDAGDDSGVEGEAF